MKILKQIFDFYINSSIHVALSCFALVKLTQFMFNISSNYSVVNFTFFGTIVAYNFVKYDALARVKKLEMRTELKLIALISFLSFIATGFYFLKLQLVSQLVGIGFLILTLLYTLPFFPNKKNARNWVGIKIYIVSICWVGITLILPIIDATIAITLDFYLKCVQRFILIFVLILIFEIIDLITDDPNLQTVPQKIGIKKTKILGYSMLVFFCFLEFLNSNFRFPLMIIELIIALIISIFLTFSDDKNSKYYSSFWAESIPILWWILVLIFC